MPPRLLSLLLLACSWPLAPAPATTHDLDDSRQCIVVLADNWTSTTGVLHAFERDGATAVWKERGPGVAVVLGKNGLGQGLGFVQLDFKGAPKKQEGDKRAPAGIFHLSYAFGYAPMYDAIWINLPYMQLSKRIEGIDDPKSRYYNRLVDRAGVATVDWHSSEQMRRDDDLYKWGVFVEHNPAAVPGAGSCIFLHIWRNSSAATAGCTAMPESDLERLLRWLDRSRDPILVQMPRANYPEVQAKYGLPPDRP
jgi:L,D-peptidoglycan transpeptidase YkuD (ErfK/YbiS/YcfS/YnhG family)